MRSEELLWTCRGLPDPSFSGVIASRVRLTILDETRPICNRCTKRGIECDGPKDTTWVIQTFAVPTTLKKQPGRSIHVPNSLSLVAFEDDICLAFTRKHLLLGSSVELACDNIQWHHGAEGYRHDPGRDLLRKAILSLSVTFFGSQNRKTATTNRGYRQYNEVLLQLNSHIAHSQLQTTNETLLTATTCMLLEIFLPTGPTNFLKHVRGIEAILEVRGPPSSAPGDAAFVVNNFRAIGIIGALATGQASLWAKPEWRNLPPETTDHGSLIKHELWNLLADCTHATSKRNRVLADGRKQQEQSLVATARALLQRSEAIYLEWGIYNHNLEGDGDGDGDGDALSYKGLDPHIPNQNSATTYMLCNAAHICILQLAHSIDPTITYGRHRHKAATNILRCLELKYFEKREDNVEVNTIGFFATKVAWEALGGHFSLEGTRLARIVEASAKGTFASGAWKDSRETIDQVYPKFTEHTIQNRWDLPLWTRKQFGHLHSDAPKQREHNNVRTRLAPVESSTSLPCPRESSDGCLPPSFFRLSHALPLTSTTEVVLGSPTRASSSWHGDLHAYVPGPFDFNDPLLGDIF